MCRLTFLAAVLLSATVVCAQAPTARSTQPPATHVRLRAAGVEPTLEGVRGYLQSLLDPQLEKQVDRWIAELSDPQFEVRERASLRLASLDFVPTLKLQAAAISPDPERAWRAKVALKGASAEAGLLPAALRVIEEEKLPVGLPLLVRLRSRIVSPAMQEAAARAMLAIVADADRPALAELQQHEDAAVRGLAGRLLARLDRPAAKFVEGSFDAVKLTPGGISGGGRNLIEGWEFRPKADIVVTHLGLFDSGGDGLAAQHEIAIWDIEDPSGPLMQETMNPGTAAPLAGAFRLITTHPIKLIGGRRYAIVAHYPDASDSTVGMINPAGLSIDYAEHVEALGRRYSFPHPSMAFPAEFAEGPKHSKHGPTFRYSLAADPKDERKP